MNTPTPSLSFLGGVGTVTGSKFLLEADGRRLLVDCGLFQGFKKLRERNWAPLPIEPSTLDAVVLTHAHLDHSGYLPLLVKNGFTGPVLSTDATRDLCSILLPDSGHLQEKDAEFANRHGFSKHRPARPLYTLEEAETALKQFAPAPFDKEQRLGNNTSIWFLPAGHILGAAIVKIRAAGRTIVFSGDLGASNSATMVDPTPMERADYLLVESTYGDRLHDREDPEAALEDIITRTATRGGTVVIPAFAVGRAQSLLFHLQRLKAKNRIPALPVYLDSPMAINASEIFCRHLLQHRLTAKECRRTCEVAEYIRAPEDSKKLDADTFPKIILSASGMATGGRVLHHLKHFLPDARNTIIFTGFQAGGTRGAAILAGARKIKIHGEEAPVRAEVANLSMLSAHADADGIMDWLNRFERPPKKTFVVHGEHHSSMALQGRISEELGWSVSVPEYQQRVTLS